MEVIEERQDRLDEMFPVGVRIQDNLLEHAIAAHHFHNFYELLFIIEGYACVEINDNIFNVEKNDLIILNCNDIHSIGCDLGHNTKFMVIQFLPEVIDLRYSKLYQSNYIMSFINMKKSMILKLFDNQIDPEYIYNQLMGLYGEFTKKDNGYEIFTKGYIYRIVSYLTKKGMVNVIKNEIQEKGLKRLEPIFKYIESSYFEKVDLENAANKLNLSYYYLSRFFKKITGKNFTDYIDYVRVCEAQRLLLTWDVSITRISAEVGFANVGYFDRVFKKYKGYSPKYFKKAKLNKEKGK